MTGKVSRIGVVRGPVFGRQSMVVSGRVSETRPDRDRWTCHSGFGACVFAIV